MTMFWTNCAGVRRRAIGCGSFFPQLAGLGRSAMAQRYALASIAEARAYRHHPVLGARLTECLRMLNDLPPDHSAIGIFGDVDAMKLRSSLTMFDCAGGDPLVDGALQRWFGGVRDAPRSR
jgi:uncharacterized protein (DUF1810 family)